MKNKGDSNAKMLKISQDLGDIPGSSPLNDEYNDSLTKQLKSTLKSETLERIKGYQNDLDFLT